MNPLFYIDDPKTLIFCVVGLVMILSAAFCAFVVFLVESL